MNAIGWRAWYAGGQIFDSANTTWEALPGTGLQVVMVYFDEKADETTPYRRIMHGDDFYYRLAPGAQDRDGSGFDQTNDIAKATRDRQPGTLKRGSLISDVEYNQITNAALLDMRIPSRIVTQPRPEEPARGILDTVMGLFR